MPAAGAIVRVLQWGRVRRFLARGHLHDPLDQARVDFGCFAWPREIFLEADHSQLQEALAPARNFLRCQVKRAGNFLILLARRG